MTFTRSTKRMIFPFAKKVVAGGAMTDTVGGSLLAGLLLLALLPSPVSILSSVVFYTRLGTLTGVSAFVAVVAGGAIFVRRFLKGVFSIKVGHYYSTVRIK